MLQDHSPCLSTRLRVDIADLGQKGRLGALARVISHSKLTDYINFHCHSAHFSPQQLKNTITLLANTHRKGFTLLFGGGKHKEHGGNSLLATAAKHFTNPHLLEQHQLCQVFLPIHDYSVLTEILTDVSLARLQAAVACQLAAAVDARLRFDDLLSDLAVLLLE